MTKYQKEYDKFYITDELRKVFTDFRVFNGEIEDTKKSILVETVILDETVSFTDKMEVSDA